MSFKTFIQFCQQSNQKTYSCSEQVWPSVCRNVLQKLLNLNQDKFAFENIKSSSILKLLKNINKTKLPVLAKFQVEFKM